MVGVREETVQSVPCTRAEVLENARENLLSTPLSACYVWSLAQEMELMLVKQGAHCLKAVLNIWMML